MSDTDTDALGASSDDAQGATIADTDPVEAPADAQVASDDTDHPLPSAHDRKLTRENAALRKRLRDAEAQLKAREEAEMSEAELLKAKLAEATEKASESESRIRNLALTSTVSQAASRFGITDADAALKLMDHTHVEWDDTQGEWIGVDDALRALAHDKPYLVATNAVAAGSTPNAPRRRSTLTVEQLKGMTQAEIDAIPEEDIFAALQGR